MAGRKEGIKVRLFVLNKECRQPLFAARGEIKDSGPNKGRNEVGIRTISPDKKRGGAGREGKGRKGRQQRLDWAGGIEAPLDDAEDRDG